MELKTASEPARSAGGQWSGKLELPMEAEIMIPDYQPPVFKVVKGLVKPVILQKQVLASRLTVEGYLRCIVYYQDENEKNLCKTEQKLPFSKTQELPEGEYREELIGINGEVEYLNCRATNSRRIEIRGAYNLHLYAPESFSHPQSVQVRENGVEQECVTIPGLQNVFGKEKTLTLEEPITLSHTPDAILEIDGLGRIDEIKKTSGKAILKGNLKMQVSYRAQDTGGMTADEKEIGFTQVMDLDAADADCLYNAWVEVIGSSLADEGEGEMNLAVTAVLHLNVYQKEELQIVRDAFSTQFQTELKKEIVFAEQLEQELDCRVPALCSGSIPEPAAQVIACFGEIQPPKAERGDKEQTLRGSVLVHVIVKDPLEEIECYDQSAEYVLPCRLAANENYRVECQAQILSISSQKSSGELTVSAEVGIRGLVLRQIREEAVLQAECGEPWPEDPQQPALRIYYARAGEKLFEVAKRFHASPRQLCECNSLEEPIFQADQHILVPGTV